MDDNNLNPINTPPTGLASEQPLNPAPVTNTTTTGEVAPNQQTESWRSIVTILFLFFSPIIGIILTWAISNWTKKVKILVTVLYGGFIVIVIGGILAATVLLGMSSARVKARDAMVKNNLRTVSSALEFYYENNTKPDGAIKLVETYPIGNSYKTMLSELSSSNVLTSPIKDPENAKYVYKYCSTDGSAFRIQVILAETGQPFELNSVGLDDLGSKDTCAPGE